MPRTVSGSNRFLTWLLKPFVIWSHSSFFLLQTQCFLWLESSGSFKIYILVFHPLFTVILILGAKTQESVFKPPRWYDGQFVWKPSSYISLLCILFPNAPISMYWFNAMNFLLISFSLLPPIILLTQITTVSRNGPLTCIPWTSLALNWHIC